MYGSGLGLIRFLKASFSFCWYMFSVNRVQNILEVTENKIKSIWNIKKWRCRPIQVWCSKTVDIQTLFVHRIALPYNLWEQRIVYLRIQNNWPTSLASNWSEIVETTVVQFFCPFVWKGSFNFWFNILSFLVTRTRAKNGGREKQFRVIELRCGRQQKLWRFSWRLVN